MKKIRMIIVVTAVAFSFNMACSSRVFAGEGRVVQKGKMTTLVIPARTGVAEDTLDYANARAMPLPQANFYTGMPAMAAAEEFNEIGAPGAVTGGAVNEIGAPGAVTEGSMGNGVETPVRLIPKSQINQSQINLDGFETDDAMDLALGGVAPAESGTGNLPFTTSRVDLSSNTVSKLYPYRASGKLFFKKSDNSTWLCSASLIKRGIVVTAAHCVAEFGKNQFHTRWSFVPAYYDGLAPYQRWSVSQAWVVSSYLDGTDPCAIDSPGIVCENDIAVLELKPRKGAYPGTNTGWLGYGVNGYGFTGNGLKVGKVALISQLGYPVSHDGGNRMQRTDSEGYISGGDQVNNTVWGSRQTGGSSGGPEVVNLGIPAVLSGGVSLGSEATFNTVVGVTSWGYINQGVKLQGASPFLSTNISALISLACAGKNPRCR